MEQFLISAWNSTLQFVTDYSFAIMAILSLVCFVAFILTLIWAKFRIKYLFDQLCDEQLYGAGQYDKWQKSSESYQKEIQLWHKCQIEVEKEHREELEKYHKEKVSIITEYAEKSHELDKLKDQLAISNNRTACAEGKLKKLVAKKLAMELAIRAYPHLPFSTPRKPLNEVAEEIYQFLKEK